MKFCKEKLLGLSLALALLLTACAGAPNGGGEVNYDDAQNTPVITDDEVPDLHEDVAPETGSAFAIPVYTGEWYVPVNGNEPYFSDADYTTDAFETYAELDELGRCGVAYANICRELMPTEERGEIGQVKPSGWHTYKYDFVDGKYLYNRCHLIGFQLAGENANERNLITGTRSFNVTGMLPFENMVADYVKETDNHVLYRVTPVYDGDNLVASGVIMEAYSVEDAGDGVLFNVYVFNVEPGVTIDYATGESWESGTGIDELETTEPPIHSAVVHGTYILNTNSRKFHTADCSGAAKIQEQNREEYTGARYVLIEDGYEPCGICKP